MGGKFKQKLLDDNRAEIVARISLGVPKNKIAEHFGVGRNTLSRYLAANPLSADEKNGISVQKLSEAIDKKGGDQKGEDRLQIENIDRTESVDTRPVDREQHIRNLFAEELNDLQPPKDD